MKLLDQYEAACKVRRLARRTIQTYRRWVDEFLQFHHDRSGGWIHPNGMGEAEVEAFLTQLAVNRRLSESTQNQALGRSPSSIGACWRRNGFAGRRAGQSS